MTKKRSPATVPGDLRGRAEKFLAAGETDLRQIPPDDVLELVQELQVHQIELEMQNEELRLAQASIAESRDRYADLYDFAPVGYFTLDPQGLILEVNLRGAKLLGTPRDLLLRKPFILFVAPGDRKAFQAHLRNLPAGGALQSCELELNPQHGPAGAISLESLAIVGAGGEVIQYRTAITDITRRRTAEDDLRRSEEKFRLLYEKAPLGYQSLDEDGIIREVNQVWLDTLGYSQQEVIGRWFGDFLPPDSYKRFPERFASANATGEVCNLDFEMVRKDGSLIAVSFYGRVTFDDQGRFQGTHCIFQDMTARKQAEEALRATEERLRLKLDSILSPDTDIGEEDLSNILDAPAIQSLMEDFSKLTGMALAIIDLQGNVLVATGWQDICTQFHRVHPQTAQKCTESDLFLVKNLRPGEHVACRCKNHLWHAATPLCIGGKHVGNIYTGQFFYDDEPVDERLFIDQAAKYGFDRDRYLWALHRVPRLSRDRVKPLMDFLMKFSALVSRLSYGNLKLAKAMSEQQRIEAALRQSEELYRYLFENMLNGFAYCKMLFEHNQPQDFICLKVNSAFEQMTGLKNVVGKKVSEIIPGIQKSDPELLEIYGRVALTGNSERFETYLEALKMWFSISVYSPEKEYFVSIFDVITERKQAEAALQSSEALLREAQRIAHIGSWNLNLLDNSFTWSDEVCRIHGLTKEKLPCSMESYLKLLHPDDRPLMEKWIGETIAQLKPAALDFRIVLPDGAVRFVRGQGELITDRAGNPERLMGTTQDITERKQAEAERDRLFNLSIDMSCIAGFDGFFKQLNPAWSKTLGWTDQELLSRPWMEFVHPEDHAATIAAGEKLAAGEAVYTFENRYLCRDGSYRWVSWNSFPLIAEGLIFCVVRDVTERKQAEAEIVRKGEQLRALAARLAEVEEAERQHLARQLHDQVSQGLTALGLTLTLLQTQMPRKAAPALLKRLADALALVEQTGETIRNLMGELRPPMLDDYGLLSTLHWYGAKFSDEKGIGVDVQGREAAPRLGAPVELALFRIVQEAMANVAQHSGATAVVLTEEEDNGTVRLIIADNGIGFGQERLSQPEGRQGWGLMTMDERAAAAGGRCRIESQPGQGTRVVVEVSR